MRWRFALVVAIGIALRLLTLTVAGHHGDLIALSTWAADMGSHGLDYYRAGGAANYPAVLWLLWPLGILFHGPELVLAIRTLAIPFDVAIAAAIFAIVRSELEEPAAIAAASLYLLNPATIIAGAYWGQVDAIGALPMLLAIAFAARRRLGLAGALATLAVLVKPQFGIGLLIVALVAARACGTSAGRWAAARAALGALATAELVLLPLGLGPTQYLGLMASSAERYPLASDQAFNLWGALLGFHAPDTGILATTGAVGLVAAAVVILVRAGRSTAELLAAGALLGLAIYFVPTRVHERYLVGAIVLLAPLAAWRPQLRVPFVGLSVLFAFTLAYALYGPHPTQPTLIPLTATEISIVSVAMIGLALASSWALAPQDRQVSWRAGLGRMIRGDRPTVVVER